MSHCRFSSSAFAQTKNRAGRESVVRHVDGVGPWLVLVVVVESTDAISDRVRLDPIGMPSVLRMYPRRRWDGVVDVTQDSLIDDSEGVQGLVVVESSRGSVTDATTLLVYRQLPFASGLGRARLTDINMRRAN